MSVRFVIFERTTKYGSAFLKFFLYANLKMEDSMSMLNKAGRSEYSVNFFFSIPCNKMITY